MNKLLPKVFQIILLIALLAASDKLSAQCACAGGVQPNIIEHYVVLPPTNSSNTTISFPKFDPAVGTLTCVTLRDTLSIVSATGIRNYDPMAVEYDFQLTINTKVEGPSLSRINFKNEVYGPDLLGAYGTPTDTINYGPDTIYNNWPSVRTNSADVTAYLGATGDVNFTYTIGGGVVAAGGANYNAQVRTNTWGRFKLTYQWCNNIVLSSGIKDFIAVREDDVIKMQWKGPENSNKSNFEVQSSNDGKTFTRIASNTNVIETASAEYKYQYTPDKSADLKTYFRIKYNDRKRIVYSELRVVQPATHSRNKLTVFPNPVQNNLFIDFEEVVSGNYRVELFNQSGQTVYKTNVVVKENRIVSLPIHDTPPPGFYYLKASSEGASKVYTGKLLFTR